MELVIKVCANQIKTFNTVAHLCFVFTKATTVELVVKVSDNQTKAKPNLFLWVSTDHVGIN